MKILAVIPARGGSKSIPNKNIYPLKGKPLITYTIEAIEKTKIGCPVVVSSDSELILEVASNSGNIIQIKRPMDLSSDDSSTEDTLIHAVHYMRKVFNVEFDAILTLQPTSPLRNPCTIEKFVDSFVLKNKECDAQITLTRTKYDLWKDDLHGNIKRLFVDAPRRRQLRDPVYIENSALYITKTEVLLQTKSVLGDGGRVNGYVISEIEGLDINEYVDLQIAECYLEIKYLLNPMGNPTHST